MRKGSSLSSFSGRPSLSIPERFDDEETADSTDSLFALLDAEEN
jgi:hypothetical protein